jgi:prolipoprotein diacylglyceryltransferase
MPSSAKHAKPEHPHRFGTTGPISVPWLALYIACGLLFAWWVYHAEGIDDGR